MRRASTCLAVLGLAVCGLTSVASAAPTVTFKATAEPIEGYKGTGNILGAGAALRSEFTISGTEYGGFPPPIIGVNVALPAGAVLHKTGWKTCSTEALEHVGPSACPKGSAAGPVGHALGIVSFGKERVEEETTVQGFFAPGGGLDFFTAGHSPVALEIVSKGKFAHVGGKFSEEVLTEVPLVETVPGAPDASVEKINVKVGAARKEHGKTIYYGTEPKTCKGGLPLKAEVLFAGLGGLAPQTVTVNYKAPCPRK